MQRSPALLLAASCYPLLGLPLCLCLCATSLRPPACRLPLLAAGSAALSLCLSAASVPQACEFLHCVLMHYSSLTCPPTCLLPPATCCWVCCSVSACLRFYLTMRAPHRSCPACLPALFPMNCTGTNQDIFMCSLLILTCWSIFYASLC